MPRLRIIGALIALLALTACAGADGESSAFDYRINNLPASASDLTTVVGYHDDLDPDRGEITTSHFLEEWQEIANPALVPYADLPAPIQALPIGQRAILDLQERTSNGQLINVLPGRYLTYDIDTALTPTEHLDAFLYLEEQPDGTIGAALIRTWTTGGNPDDRSVPVQPNVKDDGITPLYNDPTNYWDDRFVSQLDGAIVEFITPVLRPYREAYDERIRDISSHRIWSARAIATSCRPTEISTGCLYVPAEYGPIAGPYIATGEAALVDRLVPREEWTGEASTFDRTSFFALQGELAGTAVEFTSYYTPPPRPGIAALPASDQIAVLLHEGGSVLGSQALARLPSYWPPAK